MINIFYLEVAHIVAVGTHHMPVVGKALVVVGRGQVAGGRIVEGSHWGPEVGVGRL